ncbi:MAG TPA: NUDIX domain-containing protein [Gaiellaceae bacterium]|nr:NUDIX domain-containing protein [Gaiellaceae bacterium]
MPTTRTRVIVYVVRGRELLVFDGASGYGVPGGGIEAGETPEEAAIREVAEETGIAVTLVRQLGVGMTPGSFESDFVHESHFFEATPPVDVPDAWEHIVTGVGRENGTRVRCRFVPLTRDLVLVAGRDLYLPAL